MLKEEFIRWYLTRCDFKKNVDSTNLRKDKLLDQRTIMY